MSRMTQEFKSEFVACLAKKGTPPNEHFSELVAILKKHKLCYKTETLHPRLFLTHIKNRGGLLLSPHNAHKNAANIKVAGADLEALTNSWAIELPVDGPLRQELLTKNEALIARAEGLLAQVNGEERYSSIGCGHTVGWCKHAHAGGITPEKSLQMHTSSQIDLQALYQDKSFKIMISEGWPWMVVYAEVDIEFPMFASVSQKALNTRNHIANVVGELEVCMTLAANLKDPGVQQMEHWKKLVVENIVSLCAPCSQYAGTLLDYIVAYGGSDDACLIQFSDNVAKQFSANVALGQGFWKTLYETEFADKTLKYPMVRTALMLANLTGDKVEDSVARLLSKTDITKVASKAKTAAAHEAEKILQDAWQIVQAASSTDACTKPLGQLFVRFGLKLVGAEKKGREATIYTIDEMKKLFLNGVSAVVGKQIEFPKWFAAHEDTKVEEAVQAKTVAKEHVPKMATISDHYDHAFVCGVSGFKVGTMVVEKGVEVQPESIYTIFAIDDVVTLYQACSFSCNPKKVTISIDEMLKNWTSTRAEPPLMMKDPVNVVPAALRLTLKKNDIFAALMELYTKHQKHYDAFCYFRGSLCSPDHVRTTDCTIKKGNLVLVPLVPMTNIAVDSTSASRGIDAGTYDDHIYTIMPMAKAPHDGDAWDPADAFVNPYFWVGKVGDKKLVNMVPAEIVVKGLTIPVLKNPADIPPHTKLVVFVKPKAAMVPLKNATLKGDEFDENDDAPQAKAKAKASRLAKEKAAAPPAKKAKK
jgi:hypothetical protein